MESKLSHHSRSSSFSFQSNSECQSKQSWGRRTRRFSVNRFFIQSSDSFFHSHETIQLDICYSEREAFFRHEKKWNPLVEHAKATITHSMVVEGKRRQKTKLTTSSKWWIALLLFGIYKCQQLSRTRLPNLVLTDFVSASTKQLFSSFHLINQ